MAAVRPRVVAALAARFRDLDLAEDAFSDAAAAALVAWRQQPPGDHAAWLWRAAVRRAIDARRKAAVRRRAQHDLRQPEATPEELLIAAREPIPDERLRLIFVCSHPALAPDTRAALTLKVVCGLSTERLARAFLVSEPTMLQRITRAKRKIQAAGVPFAIPEPADWPERLDAVLSTLEVAYAQAYEDAALTEEAAPFTAEVLRLSGVLAEVLPQEPEVLALAALVRFAEARRPARLDRYGVMVPLEDQDPALWRRDLMVEGAGLLERSAEMGRLGARQILAAIHAAHLSRAETGAAPWAEIARLYDALIAMRPDVVVQVNRAVSRGKAFGADEGLRALAQLADEPRVQTWRPYHAARASLLNQAGEHEAAIQAFEAALRLSPPQAERRFLEQRMAEATRSLRGGRATFG
ncbi:RNA polymerase sigma factor [Phenylobacterium deserti]|uniref:RNA polymerase sigma factor n=1 Tax=Phenylobacterium deserti TaxID=1914756 RepID=A0A328AZD4_9CAUL|nr:RNA polymerase sigma factor [Phenylobacterium deserti]